MWISGEYLDPQSMKNNGPKPLKTAEKGIILHTFGVQVLASRTQIARSVRGLITLTQQVAHAEQWRSLSCQIGADMIRMRFGALQQVRGYGLEDVYVCICIYTYIPLSHYLYTYIDEYMYMQTWRYVYTQSHIYVYIHIYLLYL